MPPEALAMTAAAAGSFAYASCTQSDCGKGGRGGGGRLLPGNFRKQPKATTLPHFAVRNAVTGVETRMQSNALPLQKSCEVRAGE